MHYKYDSKNQYIWWMIAPFEITKVRHFLTKEKLIHTFPEWLIIEKPVKKIKRVYFWRTVRVLEEKLDFASVLFTIMNYIFLLLC